ncbi:MAG: hypothetical protein QOH95_2223 [Gaiellaceae bacterium]|nr:hypothetical protein [Gaiellaceae bacterium]
MFGEDEAEMPRRHFAGRDGLAAALIQGGVDEVEANGIATEFWEFWDVSFADAYYAEAQATLRAAAGVAALVVVALGVRAARGRRRRLR